MVTGVARSLTNVQGNSEPVCTINYLQFDPPSLRSNHIITLRDQFERYTSLNNSCHNTTVDTYGHSWKLTVGRAKEGKIIPQDIGDKKVFSAKLLLMEYGADSV